MKNILITGGSGLIGNKITQQLESEGLSVAWLSRNPKKYTQKSFAWDIDKNTIDQSAIEWADGIIHLAGEGVADKRWTEERKKEILESRTQSTSLLHSAIKNAKNKPTAFVSASAVGFYGFDTGDKSVDENTKPGTDFLAQVVVAWENEVKKITEMGLRTVLLRIGIVLDKDGGALKEMMKPPVAAPLGSGKQWMSWIVIDDLARMFSFAVKNEKSLRDLQRCWTQSRYQFGTYQSRCQEGRKAFYRFWRSRFWFKVDLGRNGHDGLGRQQSLFQKNPIRRV